MRKVRRLCKFIIRYTWKPFVQRYLRRPRRFIYKGIQVTVQPGVFHPGFFFSSTALVDYLSETDLNRKKFLEIGCGSGIVSILAARKGAIVTCTDISASALSCTHANARKNNADIVPLRSDLFNAIPPHEFDVIAVNPPYYRKNPDAQESYAWNAGENLEFFRRFFKDASRYVHGNSELIMVLSDECDLKAIREIAELHGWTQELMKKKANLLETIYIFRYHFGQIALS